jgi:hypothetical protein
MPQSAYKNKLSHFFDLLGQAIKGGEHDYTKGSLRGAIILLAIPMILELSFESIFAVVDIFFVSKLGSEAIQTVGLTESALVRPPQQWWPEEWGRKTRWRHRMPVCRH